MNTSTSLKINNLDAALKHINECAGCGRLYVQLSYDMETGDLYWCEYADCNSYSTYDDTVITVGFYHATRHTKADLIRDIEHSVYIEKEGRRLLAEGYWC